MGNSSSDPIEEQREVCGMEDEEGLIDSVSISDSEGGGERDSEGDGETKSDGWGGWICS